MENQSPTSSFCRRSIAPALLLMMATGCDSAPELAFAPRADLASLPENHRRQIADSLVEYYGPQGLPHFREPAPADDDASEEVASKEVASDEAGDESSEEVEKIPLVDAIDPERLRLGREVYLRQCAPCHGVTGDGQGPAAKYLDPPPRDYRLGKFKFTSTPRGLKPRRSDLVRIVKRGAKGTSMPAFRWMAEEELQAVIDYVLLLASRGELEYRLQIYAEQDMDESDDFTPDIVAGEAIFIADAWKEAEQNVVQPLTPMLASSPEAVTEGAKAFVQLNCYKCHGRDGRGAKQSDVGKDDWGRTAYAADLTTGMLHGGRRPIDIYRRIYSGVNATPMPAFGSPDSSRNETPAERSDTIWRLTQFVTSIVDGQPLPMDIIDAAIAEQLQANPPADDNAGGN